MQGSHPDSLESEQLNIPVQQSSSEFNNSVNNAATTEDEQSLQSVSSVSNKPSSEADVEQKCKYIRQTSANNATEDKQMSTEDEQKFQSDR